MNPTWLKEIKEALPLKIDSFYWDGAQLTILGKDWSFNTISSWRILDSQKMITSCQEESYDYLDSKGNKTGERNMRSCDYLKNIVGLSIVKCESSDISIKIDPCFVFSNDLCFEVFSDSFLEPWVIRFLDRENKVCEIFANPGVSAWATK